MRLLIVSDPHFWGAEEQKSRSAEQNDAHSRAQRLFLKCYRRYFWLREPGMNGRMLSVALRHPEPVDRVIVNGDLSADAALVGLSDAASLDSAKTCLERIRSAVPGAPVHVTLGDHDLGKRSMLGDAGRMRPESLEQAAQVLGARPMWSFEADGYLFLGVCSPLIAAPAHQADIDPAEATVWRRLRAEHLDEIRVRLSRSARAQRIALFCHDPTALPFLVEEKVFCPATLERVAVTVIGHLHSRWIWRASRILRGMPAVTRLGGTVKKLSGALRRGTHWTPFRPVLCPSPAGIQIAKDGGYLTLETDPSGPGCRVRFHRLRWRDAPPPEKFN